MNITNESITHQANATDPWVESGAMVYVALTVATLSATIMCCVWFVKQRFIHVNKYGTVSTSGEEHVELNAPVTRESSGSEEDISLEPDEISLESVSQTGQESPPNDAFTISEEDSDSGSDNIGEHAV